MLLRSLRHSGSVPCGTQKTEDGSSDEEHDQHERDLRLEGESGLEVLPCESVDFVVCHILRTLVLCREMRRLIEI